MTQTLGEPLLVVRHQQRARDSHLRVLDPLGNQTRDFGNEIYAHPPFLLHDQSLAGSSGAISPVSFLYCPLPQSHMEGAASLTRGWLEESLVWLPQGTPGCCKDKQSSCGEELCTEYRVACSLGSCWPPSAAHGLPSGRESGSRGLIPCPRSLLVT